MEKNHFFASIRHAIALVLLACLSLSNTSCTKEDPNSKLPPVVTLNAVTSTETSVSFKLSATNADELCYLVVAADKTEKITVEQIFADGKVALASMDKEYKVENLEFNQDYNIYAAAQNKNGYSEIATLKMKTNVPQHTLVVRAGENVTSNGFDFFVTSSHAAKVAWMVVKKGEATPAADRILTEGTAVECGPDVNCTAQNLAQDTEYQVIAAATDLNNENAIVSEVINIRTLLPAEAKIGDFYYSDGTWSTELDPAKTPIGIVFYIKAATEFKDNASYYKLKDEKTPMKEINGYVVALQDATFVDGQNLTVSWSFFDGRYEGAGCSAQKNDFLGYTNTQAIKVAAKKRPGELTANDDSFPATYYATIAYEKACPAPASSSGWFLPSSYQFKYIYDNVYFNKSGNLAAWLEKSFETLGSKATPLLTNDARFWTSTEKYDSDGHSYWAHYFNFEKNNFRPGFISDQPKMKSFRVRSMLVF